MKQLRKIQRGGSEFKVAAKIHPEDAKEARLMNRKERRRMALGIPVELRRSFRLGAKQSRASYLKAI